LRGLEYLHKFRISHRDLKPQNIILFNEGLKITDFGISLYHSVRKRRKTFSGTDYYAPPEVINMYEDIDYISSDIYSFGVILFQMITGSRKLFFSEENPFPDDTYIREKKKNFEIPQIPEENIAILNPKLFRLWSVCKLCFLPQNDRPKVKTLIEKIEHIQNTNFG